MEFLEDLHKQAFQCYENKAYKEAIKIFNLIITFKPYDVNAYIGKGTSLIALKQYSDAMSCFDKAIELNPNSSFAHGSKGVVLAELKLYKEALECYDKAIELNPECMMSHNNKGITLNELKQYEEGLKYSDKAIQISSDYADAHHNKGISLHNLNRYQEALDCYNKAIELNPSYAEAYNSRGTLLKNLNKHKEAIKNFDKSIKLDPKSSLPYYNKGGLFLENNKPKQAIICFDKAIELDPNNDEIYHGKGLALVALEKFDEALECYNKAIFLNPNSTKIYNNKGILFTTLGRDKEAIECYNQAIEADPSYANPYNNKGASLIELKQYQEAITCFEKAIELDPEDPNAYKNKVLAEKDLKEQQAQQKQFTREKRQLLKTIKISGFKSIKEQTIELEKINIFIGANGVGKSNFVSAMQLMTDTFNNNINKYVLNKTGQVDELFFQYGNQESKEINLGIKTENNHYQIKYAKVSDNRLIIKEETINTHKINSEVLESNYLNLPLTENDIRHTLNYIRVFHFNNTMTTSPLRSPQSIDNFEEHRGLLPDGSNLNATLWVMQLKHQDRYKEVVRLIRMIAPYFDDFVLSPDPQKPELIKLRWKMQNSDNVLSSYQLSDGTLRFIAMMVAIYQPVPPTVAIFDEPELGLHPEAIYVLSGAIRSMSEQIQTIITTQSPLVLNEFEVNNIIISERDDGETKFTKPKEKELARWLKKYSLGDLWNMNLLGAGVNHNEK